jgi:putative membrane protein
MPSLSQVLIVVVALLHVSFMILETFLWRARAGSLFRISPAAVEATAPLAANQGLYNLFLAAGLLLALAYRTTDVYLPTATFVLACVVAAGVFGAVTVSPRIFFLQALPAIAALVALRTGY